MKFDVIVGNPPYQGAKSETAGDKGKPPTIWPRFVEIANGLLKSDGLLIMVHPAMYRKPGITLQNILLNNNRELHMYNNAEAMKTFGASTRYDWYVVDKTYHGLTEVYFEDETHRTIQLEPGMFLPNGSWDVWQQVQSHGNFLEPVKKADSAGPGPFKIVQTLTKTKGLVVESSTKMPKTYGIPKVILSETGCEAYYDKEGKLGMTSNCYFVYVTCDEEAEAIVRFVGSKLCDHLVESCKWGNFRTEMCLWKYIPNPYHLGINKDSTEQDILDAFGVTESIDFVYGKCRKTL